MLWVRMIALASFLDGFIPADPIVAGLVIIAVVAAAVTFVVIRARERKRGG